MTRINADFDTTKLLDQHLMAEYRELPMVYAALRRSLHSKSINTVIRSIPEQFTLNRGHVTFFYDKLKFLDARYAKLIAELKTRGYQLDDQRQYNVNEFATPFVNDWEMSQVDKRVIAERMFERYSAKPDWYRYMGKRVTKDEVAHLFELEI